jgi:hypothetical protein
MNAPRRWIDEGGSATPLERDLLRSALSAGVEPPPDAQKQVWAAVLAQIPAAAGAAGGAGGAAAAKGAAAKIAVATKAGAGIGGSAGGASLAGAAAGAGLLKSVLIGAGSAVAVLATYSAVAPPDPGTVLPRPPAVVAPAPVAPKPAGVPRRAAQSAGPVAPPTSEPAPAEAPILAAPPERHAPPVATGAEPQAPNAAGLGGGNTVAPVPAAPAERETMIREESRVVGEARAALRRGDASGALTQLDQIQARFPGGVLGQEREALTIEALARSGRRAEASTRASAFLQAHPTSVLAGRMQPFRDGAENGPKPRAPAEPFVQQ